MNRLTEIRERMQAIRTDLDAVENRLTEDNVSDTETEELHLRSEGLLQEFDALKDELEPLQARQEKIDAVRAAAEDARNRSASFHAPNVNIKRDPHEGVREALEGNAHMPASELRSRALTVIENASKRSDGWGIADASAQAATAKVEADRIGTDVAKHIMKTSSPEYLTHFRNYVNDPVSYRERAVLSLTAADGGYLLPFVLDPSIILTNDGTVNPIRQLADVKQTTQNVWHGVTSAGVTTSWTNEAADFHEGEPDFAQPSVTCYKATSWVQGSVEILSDSDFGAQLPRLFQDARDLAEATAFTVGTGSNQPKGLVTAATAITGSSATAISRADVVALRAALKPRWRSATSRNAWLASQPVIDELRTIPKFATAVESLVNDNGAVPTMFNKPVLETSAMDETLDASSKVLVYGDLAQYVIAERIGVSIAFVPTVFNHSTGLPNGESGWALYWRVGADLLVPAAVQVLELAAS